MSDSTREERGEKGKVTRQRSSRMARKEFFKRWVSSQLGGRRHWLLLATAPFFKATRIHKRNAKSKDRYGSTSE
jgi:hypothetical protein